MKSLNIGVVAYGVDPSLVMVRVPNERGRWLLTDRCVVEIDCPFCLAVAGEPCRKWLGGRFFRRHGIEPPEPPPAESIRYGVGVHVARKSAAAQKFGGNRWAMRQPPHKLRIRADELAEIQTPLSEAPEPEPDFDNIQPGDLDISITERRYPCTPREIEIAKKANPLFGVYIENDQAMYGGVLYLEHQQLVEILNSTPTEET